VEQNRGPEHESMQLCSPNFSQSFQKHDGEKTASSTNVAGILDICLQKTETRPMFVNLYKYQPKVD
jgi:hypothetical protein